MPHSRTSIGRQESGPNIQQVIMAHNAIVFLLSFIGLLLTVNGQSLAVDGGFFYCHHHRLPTAINDDTVRVQLDSNEPQFNQNATVYKGKI